MKAIIFDMDGVLVDSMPYHAEAWKRTFADISINIDRRDIYELEGSNHRQIVEIIFGRLGKVPDEKTISDLNRKKIELFNRIEQVKPFAGMQDLISLLKMKYKLAMVSGSNKVTVRNIIDAFFPGAFQVIIDGDDIGKSKPSPEPYLKAVERLAISKEECIVIENAPMGVISAKNAGLRCIAVPTYLEKESLKGADLIVNDHYELIKFLTHDIEKIK